MPSENATATERNILRYLDLITHDHTLAERIVLARRLNRETLKLNGGMAQRDILDRAICQCDSNIARQRLDLELACALDEDMAPHQAMLKALVDVRWALAATRTEAP